MLQLETIYVLEGLGPPKEYAPGTKSFKEQVSISHTAAAVQIPALVNAHRAEKNSYTAVSGLDQGMGFASS